MSNSRREFLIATAASACVLWHRSGSAHASADQGRKFAEHAWERDHRSPIFVPRSDFDASGAQGPFVVLHDAERWIFYAGIGKDGLQRTMFRTYALAEAARPDGLTSDRGTVAQPAERQTDDMSVDRVHSELFRYTDTFPFRLPEIGSVSQPSNYSSGRTTQTSRVSLRAYTQLPA